MMDLQTAFREYLRDTPADRVVWGQDDCTAWTKRWGEIVTGEKIWGPAYSSREEAMEIIREYGSLEKLWEHGLSLSGFYPEAPHDLCTGCVGVIDTHRYGQVGVPFLEGGVAAWRADTGRIGWIRPRAEMILSVWRLA